MPIIKEYIPKLHLECNSILSRTALVYFKSYHAPWLFHSAKAMAAEGLIKYVTLILGVFTLYVSAKNQGGKRQKF